MLLLSRYEYNPQAALIGKGGLARVYKALDKALNITLALKIWKTGGDPSVPYIPVADRPGLISLSHPNIVRYLAIEEMEKEDAFGEVEKIQVCALEWLDGGSLTQYYASPKNPAILPKTPALLEKLLPGLIDGLSYLHRSGLAHLNSQASNMLLQEPAEGPVGKIAAFGTIKPPGLEGKAAYDADFQSLGAVFYELLTGQQLLLPGEALLLPGAADKLRQLPQPFRDLLFNQSAEPAATAPLAPAVPMPAPPPASSDDTQILPAKPPPAPVQSDDTQILSPKPKPAASDDTQLLSPKPNPVSAASDDTQILPPRKEETLSLFSRYEYNPTTGLIGKGGFSRVYKAFDKKLNRWVALKIYKGGELCH